jgi:hypothetical protein
MRKLAFFALASVAAGALVFLACGSDTGATPGGSSGSSSSSGNNASSSSGNNGGEEDAGIPDGATLSPSGCLIYCTQPMKATKIVSLPRDPVPNDPEDTTPDQAHQVAWTNPNGGLTQDSETATVTLAEGQESQWLAVSGFDFSSITDGRETWGIIVELTRQSDDGGVTDSRMEVIIDGQQDVIHNHPFQGSWPRVQIGTHHYGQAIDTWGANLNPSDVRKPTFGARVAAKRLPGITGGPVIATIDSLKVAVCACNEKGK